MNAEGIPIQIYVPICPNCTGIMKYQRSIEQYRCINCGSRYKIVDQGKNDRIVICKEITNNVRM